MTYEPSWESLKQHAVPDWFNNAKLGVMIHWGLASVPAWAPIDGNPHELIKHKGFEYYFAHNPYVEWYYNSIQIEGSPSQKYHLETYGPDFAYSDFAPVFNRAIESWDPNSWSKLFKQVGIKYVVLVTKHHDGFLLWSSQYPNPVHDDYHTKRDVVGELTKAVRDDGMKMGLYYSGGLDWSLHYKLICDIPTLYECVGQSQEFVDYVDDHWRELINLYTPDILWGDIAYPALANLPKIFADYYNLIPNGVINDRFAQELPDSLDATDVIMNPANKHFDFNTPEYSYFSSIKENKWECTRGLGYSFTYNMNESAETHLSFEQLVHLLVDVVSKNGNLLLGVTPMADGAIPIIQQQLLENLGNWLAINGEAIFDTSCWVMAEAKTTNNIPVRFTRGQDCVYAIILGRLPNTKVIIEALRIDDNAEVQLLGYDKPLKWQQQGNNVSITLPAGVDFFTEPAYALKIVSQHIHTIKD